jgi:hypothetical protein
MNLPDLTALTLSQIVAMLATLAGLVFISGVGKAISSSTVLWTYVAAWLSDWLGKGLVLAALAAAGKGVPGILEPNQLVDAIFVAGGLTYIAAALAAIAKNVGVDLSKLPFASRAATVFGADAVRADVVPATTSGPPPR